MRSDFVDLTPETAADASICCIVRAKKSHPGIEAKRTWLSARLKDGHVFRKVAAAECAFIEYAPLETAFIPVEGENYLYIYCLWVQGAPRGQGFGRRLMESCLEDARVQGRSGVCMLGAEKQKAWLSDQSFARKFGFQPVDTAGEYSLLALSLDGTVPRFSDGARHMAVDAPGLVVYYSDQCPFIPSRVDKLREYCAAHDIPAQFIHVDSAEKARALPCVFNNWAVFYDGRFRTVNQIDGAALERLRRR